MKRILVTGAAGFIGSHLVRRLIDEGVEVRVIELPDRLSRISEMDGVEVVSGDIRDQETCVNAVKGCDAVSHLAAQISFDGTQDEIKSWEVNVGGTFNMLKASLSEGVKKFHFMSTGLVLGDVEKPHKADEEWVPKTPKSAYAYGKYAGETLCRNFSGTYGVPVVITRAFNVFGPGQNPDSRGAMISKFIDIVLKGGKPKVFGDGSQTKDWAYISDIIDGIYKSIISEQSNGEIIHLCSGVERSVEDIAKDVIAACGNKFEPEYINMRYADFGRSVGNNSKARKLLGWDPSTGFEDGLRKTIEWFRANPSENRK